MEEYEIIRKSPFSGKTNSMVITMNIDDYEAWQDGQLIQVALPYLTADEREFLMTGITPEEWEEAFGTD